MTNPELERRTLTAQMELRDGTEDGSTPTITGYALKFNKPSEVLGGFVAFREIIKPGALAAADMTNVVATINHDQNQVLGRTGINLDLAVDEIGLRFTVQPTDTSFAKDLIANMQAGVINQCSFAFTIPATDGAQDWEESDEDGVDYVRSINQIDHLYDVSIVTTPAYPSTEAQVGERSLAMVKESRRALHQAEVDTEIKQMRRELDRQELLKSL